MTFVAIWRYINKTELNFIELNFVVLLLFYNFTFLNQLDILRQMVNGLYLYNAFLADHSRRFYTTATFTYFKHILKQHVLVYTVLLATQSFSFSIIHINTLMDASVDNLWFSILPKDASTCGPGKLGVELSTIGLTDDCSSSCATAAATVPHLVVS